MWSERLKGVQRSVDVWQLLLRWAGGEELGVGRLPCLPALFPAMEDRASTACLVTVETSIVCVAVQHEHLPHSCA